MTEVTKQYQNLSIKQASEYFKNEDNIFIDHKNKKEAKDGAVVYTKFYITPDQKTLYYPTFTIKNLVINQVKFQEQYKPTLSWCLSKQINDECKQFCTFIIKLSMLLKDKLVRESNENGDFYLAYQEEYSKKTKQKDKKGMKFNEPYYKANLKIKSDDKFKTVFYDYNNKEEINGKQVPKQLTVDEKNVEQILSNNSKCSLIVGFEPIKNHNFGTSIQLLVKHCVVDTNKESQYNVFDDLLDDEEQNNNTNVEELLFQD